jgi:hypothetical protein
MSNPNLPKKESAYAFPSVFGSHAIMVHEEHDDGTTVTCRDEFGLYITQKNRLDDGMADPNRYKENRLGKLVGGKAKEEKV